MSMASSRLRRSPSMEDDQSFGGARPGGSEPVLGKRTTHDIAEAFKAPYELNQTVSINKAPSTDSSRDGPPSPKRRKVCSTSYSKPSHPSTRRIPANPGISNPYALGTHRGPIAHLDHPFDFNGPSPFRAFPSASIDTQTKNANPGPARNRAFASNEVARPDASVLRNAAVYGGAITSNNVASFSSARSESGDNDLHHSFDSVNYGEESSNVSTFGNADSFGYTRFGPSDYNLQDHNRRNLNPADFGGRGSRTTTLIDAPGSKDVLSSFNSNPDNFDNDNSTEEDAAPFQPTVQSQRGRKTGRLMAGEISRHRTLIPDSFDNDNGTEENAEPPQLTNRPQPRLKSGRFKARNSHRPTLNPVSVDDDSDTEDEDAELAAKIQRLREPESLTAIQLVAKAGLGGNSRLALLLKSRGRDDTVIVSRGGWSDYKPLKIEIPEPVVKRPRGRPRIHPEGSKGSKKKSGTKAGQQPKPAAQPAKGKTLTWEELSQPLKPTAQPDVEKTLAQEELDNLASMTAGVDPPPDTRSMHLRSSTSIRLPARYSDVSFTTTKDDIEQDELAGDGPKPQRRGIHSAAHIGARYPGRKVNSAVAQESSGSDLTMAVSADLDESSQGLERQQVSTLVVFSTSPGKCPREAEAEMKKWEDNKRKISSRKSSAVKKKKSTDRPYAAEGIPTMQSLPQDLQDAEKEVSTDHELAASSQASENGVPVVYAQPAREIRDRTLRSSTGPSSTRPSSTGRKSQDVQKVPGSVSPSDHGKSTSAVTVRPGAGEGIPTMLVSKSFPQDSQDAGNEVKADPELAASSQASENDVLVVDAPLVRETRSRTLRSSTGPSSTGPKSQDVQKLPDSVAFSGNEKSTYTVTVHDNLQQGSENRVMAKPKVARPPQAYTTPAKPQLRNLRSKPEDKVSLPQSKGSSKRTSNGKATVLPVSDTASTLPATPSARVMSAQEKGWITRKANEALNAGQKSGQKSEQKSGQKSGQKSVQKSGQKLEQKATQKSEQKSEQKSGQKKSSSAPSADAQPTTHRFSLRESKTSGSK